MATMTVARLDGAVARPEEVAAALARDGCCVVDHLVGSDVMDRLAQEVAPFVEAARFGRDDFSGTVTRRTGSLVARSPTFRDALVAHPLVVAATDAVLRPHAPRTQLHLTQVIDIGPGENGQMLHRDQWAFDFPFPAGMECLCNTMWALTDFTEANGGTRVIPGSNHWADKLKPGYDESVAVAMDKGSVLFYTGAVYHGGGANTTEQRRAGINVGYTLSWLRQEENQYLACPPEVARTLPIELLRLIGYSMGGYALGYFGDVQDPLEALGIDPRAAKGNGRYTIAGTDFS
jgi:ectoine hydroxylase-related dioxygenase (phytanoyl-CoA dioxygenase family)